jgi:HTH-type transcriptional regulator, competence development regulator
MSRIGEFLKKLRTEKGLSFREAAEKTGLSHSYIRYVEIGKRPGSETPINPTPETLKRFAKAYDYPYEELMRLAGYLDEDGNETTASDDDGINTLAQINQLIKEYGIEQMGFFDIEKWKSLSEEEIEEIIKHFEWVVHKAKEKNKAAREDTED